jgi:hypothetical protein
MVLRQIKYLSSMSQEIVISSINFLYSKSSPGYLLCIISAYVLSCVGSDLAIGWSPVRRVLIIACKLHSFRINSEPGTDQTAQSVGPNWRFFMPSDSEHILKVLNWEVPKIVGRSWNKKWICSFWSMLICWFIGRRNICHKEAKEICKSLIRKLA